MTTFLIISAIAFVWIVSGVIAYGTMIADSHQIWSDFTRKYGDEEWRKQFVDIQGLAVFCALCGPIGLLASWVARLNSNKRDRAKGLRFQA